MSSVFIYNENCVMAGKQVSQREIYDYDGGPSDCSDWHEEELTEENAEYHEGYADGHPNLYHLQIASTIRDVISPY